MFKRPVVYVQIRPGMAVAKRMDTSEQATATSVALSHPRTLMGDFTQVEACLKEVFETLGVRSWRSRAAIALIHLVPKADGGYTNVELRAFREAALGAGAAQAYLLADHPPLTSDQENEIKSFFGKGFR